MSPSFNRNYSKATKQTYKHRSYRSKAEAAYAMYLDQMVKDKEIKSWEYEKKIELCGENGTRVCNYYIDFTIQHNDGKVEYIEVKGFPTSIWRLKWKLFNDKFGHDHNIIITLEKV